MWKVAVLMREGVPAAVTMSWRWHASMACWEVLMLIPAMLKQACFFFQAYTDSFNHRCKLALGY